MLEMQPASYAILATNEAEKAAAIKVVDYRMIGATGRVYLTGDESDVRAAAEAAERPWGGRMNPTERPAPRTQLPTSCGKRSGRCCGKCCRPASARAPQPLRVRLDGSLAGEVTSTDADLTALVRRMAALCDDPATRAALRDGRHWFRLAGPPAGSRDGVARLPTPTSRGSSGAP